MIRRIIILLVVVAFSTGAAGCSRDVHQASKSEYRDAMSAATRAHDGRIQGLDTDSDKQATKTYRAFAASYSTMVDQMHNVDPASDAVRRIHLKLLQALQAQESVLTESVAIVSEGGVAQVESDPKLKAQRERNNVKRDAAIAQLQKLGWLDQDFYVDD